MVLLNSSLLSCCGHWFMLVCEKLPNHRAMSLFGSALRSLQPATNGHTE